MRKIRLVFSILATVASMPGTHLADPMPQKLPPTPEAVTSFGAVTTDGWLYTFGGHQGERHAYTAEMVSGSFHRLQLVQGQSWERLPSAAAGQGLALVAHHHSVIRVGGMDSHDSPTLAVDIYDTETGKWSKGPDLPPGRAQGFGCSAIAQDGRLYASAFQGDLLRLSDDESAWEIVGRLDPPRISHRRGTAPLSVP